MIIKLLLLLAGVGLVAFFIANRRKARAKAGVKIGFLLFIVFGLYAVVRPDDITWLANRLGVQRGSDLMLYALIMAFAFVTVSTYVRFREQELRYARLARAVALQNAVRPEAAYDDATANAALAQEHRLERETPDEPIRPSALDAKYPDATATAADASSAHLDSHRDGIA